MEALLLVMQIITIVALTILCVYLINVLVRVRNILTVVEIDIKELTAKAIPVFTNLEVITDKIKNVTENIDEQVEMVKSSILSIKEIADNVVNLERKVQERIEEPVLETVGTLAAVINGVRTFIARLRA
ncbi:MAG: hypothetical protein HY800_08395 [Ignavibacteriales bacterium]|nr:hypothetical protein [Ignavibacteriales bacterium]